MNISILNRDHLSELEAYNIARTCLPEKIDTSCKCNGDSSGKLQVFRLAGNWHIRYMCAFLVVNRNIDKAVSIMKNKLNEYRMIHNS